MSESLRHFLMGVAIVGGFMSLFGIGYALGQASVLKKIMKFYAIYHAGNPVEGQDLIKFLSK